MKIALKIIGILCIVGGIVSIFQFSPGDVEITQYEKGYLWGNIILLLLGLILLYFGFRKSK